MATELTKRQAAFVAAYVADPSESGKGAAIRAGYSPASAEVQASRLLRSDKVRAAVREAKEALSSELNISRRAVLEEIASIAFGRITDTVEWGDFGVRLRPSAQLTDRQAAAIAEISEAPPDRQQRLPGLEDDPQTRLVGRLRVKMHDKLGALAQLARHFNLYSDEAPPPPGESLEIKLSPELAALARQVANELVRREVRP